MAELRILNVTNAGTCGCPACRAGGPVAASDRTRPPEPPTFDQVDRHFRGEDLPPAPQPVQNPRLDVDYAEAARVQHLPEVRYPIDPAEAARSGFGVMPLPTPLGPEDFK